MTVIECKNNYPPTYIALSTDISSGSIVGTPKIGGTVFTTDDQAWYIVAEASGSKFYLQDYKAPPLAS